MIDPSICLRCLSFLSVSGNFLIDVEPTESTFNFESLSIFFGRALARLQFVKSKYSRLERRVISSGIGNVGCFL